MSDNTKSKSGLNAVLRGVTLGATISGDGITPLADNSWFRIESIATSGSTLPIGKVTAYFKTPDSGNAITPATGDDVKPVTFTDKCKVTSDLANEKGTIDVTDDCSDGYMSWITDGFTGITGTYEQFLKFDQTDNNGLVESQKEVLNRFYDLVEDDGAGTYTVTDKNDDDLVLFILLTRKAAIGDKVTYFIVPTILGTANTTQDNKAGMNLSVSWSKAEGWAGLYERVLNVALDL